MTISCQARPIQNLRKGKGPRLGLNKFMRTSETRRTSRSVRHAVDHSSTRSSSATCAISWYVAIAPETTLAAFANDPSEQDQEMALIMVELRRSEQDPFHLLQI